MSEFFQPPSAAPFDEALSVHPPPRGRRPYDTPPGVVATDVLIARSAATAIHIAYLDAYPTGFEFRVDAVTSAPDDALRRDREQLGLDVFGRHWLTGGEERDELPSGLLRIGVEFADERRATNITGHSQPLGGPSIWPLAGGGGGGRVHQGYWVSPLPPPGPVALVCEWPAAGIPLVRHEIDGELILEAAERARPIYCPDGPVTRVKDARDWAIGTDAEVGWINAGVSPGRTITAAIPPVFDSYCTLELPGPGPGEGGLAQHEQAVMALLNEFTASQPWWLGYLDTGASYTVFPDAPVATVYYGYGYVLVKAGPHQAATWREKYWNSWALPDLMFRQTAPGFCQRCGMTTGRASAGPRSS